MRLLEVRANQRLYVHGKRLHHGLTGCVLITVGAVLAAHDWHDRWWLHD